MARDEAFAAEMKRVAAEHRARWLATQPTGTVPARGALPPQYGDPEWTVQRYWATRVGPTGKAGE